MTERSDLVIGPDERLVVRLTGKMAQATVVEQTLRVLVDAGLKDRAVVIADKDNEVELAVISD